MEEKEKEKKSPNQVLIADSIERIARTVDRVDDLAVCATCPALLDLGVVELEELVQPGE